MTTMAKKLAILTPKRKRVLRPLPPRTPLPRNERREHFPHLDTVRMVRRLSNRRYRGFSAQLRDLVVLRAYLNRPYCSYCGDTLTRCVLEHNHGLEGDEASFRGLACYSCNGREAAAVAAVEAQHNVDRNVDMRTWPSPAREMYVARVALFVAGSTARAQKSRARRVLQL
jgi:hypothetical protein